MQYFLEGRTLLAELGIEPAYIVGPLGNFAPISAAQERLLEMLSDDTLAMISPVTDLWFKDTALKYDWAGRGPCIVFCQNPFSFTKEKFLGTCLHEAGHWLNYFDHRSRDDQEHERAKRNGQLKGESHSRRWLQGTINLWHRACRMGYEIPLDAATRFDEYGFSRADLLPLLDEASRREGEDIESILRGSVAA